MPFCTVAFLTLSGNFESRATFVNNVSVVKKISFGSVKITGKIVKRWIISHGIVIKLSVRLRKRDP